MEIISDKQIFKSVCLGVASASLSNISIHLDALKDCGSLEYMEREVRRMAEKFKTASIFYNEEEIMQIPKHSAETIAQCYRDLSKDKEAVIKWGEEIL